MDSHVLYAMPGSLYSAKARSYLRKQRIDHVERAPGDARFAGEVMPVTRRWIIPVLQTPDGELIQDTVDIIDHLECERAPAPGAYPSGACQLVVAHLLELFGGEGLLRPAMHYRWNFDSSNLDFLFADFTAALVPGGDSDARRAVFEYASARMRKATVNFGVTAERVAEIESSYMRFLDLLDDHLKAAPYLLGGRPTIADYGFIGPLFAHLARDPYPSAIMKAMAQRVWRWVERMNAPVLDASEYGDCSQQLFADDQIPPSLERLLAFIGEEFAGEALATVRAIDEWLQQHPHTREGDVIGGAPERRMTGRTTFDWRGAPMTIGVIPYRLYLIQRLQGAHLQASPAEQDGIRRLLSAAGLEQLLQIRPRRRLARSANLDVWGSEQDADLGL